MSGKIEVSPTPIQRHLNDVALELTMLAIKADIKTPRDPDSIERLYRKFYKATNECRAGTY
jgi:hypothetical protein